MHPRCEKHHIRLRRVILSSGKLTWLCQYSHGPRFRFYRAPATCRKGKEPGVYSEGFCYPCWYYR